jgi:hypothetical protein
VPAEAQPDEPPEVDFAGQTFESPTLQYVQGVTFQGLQPQAVWSYDKLSRIERPGPARKILMGDVAMEVFHDCYGGLASGIAWRYAT